MNEFLLKSVSNLDLVELGQFAKLYGKRKKSSTFAWFLWAFFGFTGAHRFYLGNYGSGLILLALTVFSLGLFAPVYYFDMENMDRLVYEANKQVVLDTVKEVKSK